MSKTTDIRKLEPISVSKDGKRRYYDAVAKMALVQACLEPGASLSGLALRAGVNANLLRKWVKDHQACAGKATRPAVVSTAATNAFVAVVAASDAMAQAPMPLPTVRAPASACSSDEDACPVLRVIAQMPNGVRLEVKGGAGNLLWMATMIDALGALR